MNFHNENVYSEDALEQATIARLAELGWDSWAQLAHESATHCPTSGRASRADVVLPARLRAALTRLNPDLPGEAIAVAVEELARDRSALSLVAANREIYHMLKVGVPVTFQRVDPSADSTAEQNGTDVRQQALVQVIDWRQPARNDFFLAQQLWISGPHHTRRPDLIGFVNGLPLLLMELKKQSVHLKHAYDDNLRDYKDTIPQLFWYSGLVLLSNGSDARLGSFTAGWDHFARWKRINSEGEAGIIGLDTLLQAACPPDRLLDLVENFTLFDVGRGETSKIVAKNHQYLGVNNAVDAVGRMDENGGRLGVFWHTQGSGKSYSMVFFCQKVLRKIPGNWTFLILTDRLDLDDQIYKTFAAVGAVTEPEGSVRAQSGAHLQQLLREDHRYLFTLIQKFGIAPGQVYPVLSLRDDIIVITDEAHRSQYDVLAQNMRTALPNAGFIGFTGTPLIAGEEEKTRELYGDYVSVYDFARSIEDEATVPLFYVNRIPEVEIVNQNFDREMEQILEQAELDDAQEARLAREFAREYHIITRSDRLDKIAEDIVQHFLGRGFRGKAMVVSIDKLTAGRMLDRVQHHWQAHLSTLEARHGRETDPAERAQLAEKIRFMRETDMALVVSQGQNEIAQFAAHGLDIRPHRARMNREPLDEHFKDPDHPLRLVFVCAMWMTGFDVPSCSTIYLDKPMRNHTLMQTIARANRVYGGKASGTIVDYIGVFRNLQEALAIYGTGGDRVRSGNEIDAENPSRDADGTFTLDNSPIKPKAALVDELATAIENTRLYMQKHGAALDAITNAPVSIQGVFPRIQAIDEAVEALVGSDDARDGYLVHAAGVLRLFRAILPDERANIHLGSASAIKAVRDTIRSLMEPADISQVMDAVEDLLDRSIAGYAMRNRGEEPFNLGQIDFEGLRRQFAQGRKQTQALKLRGQLNSQLQTMVRLNKTRVDLAQRYQEMVDAYNEGRLSVDEFFERLLAFAQTLQAEEQRRMAEALDEEELALFDLLLKPRPELTKEEIEQVKAIARDLLVTLKSKRLILDWRKQQRARAAVHLTIEEQLERLPDAYEEELWQQKVEQVYSHIFDNYYGAEQSVYSRLAM